MLELAWLLSIEDFSRILTLPPTPSFCGLQLLYILNLLFRHSLLSLLLLDIHYFYKSALKIDAHVFHSPNSLRS